MTWVNWFWLILDVSLLGWLIWLIATPLPASCNKIDPRQTSAEIKED